MHLVQVTPHFVAQIAYCDVEFHLCAAANQNQHDLILKSVLEFELLILDFLHATWGRTQFRG